MHGFRDGEGIQLREVRDVFQFAVFWLPISIPFIHKISRQYHIPGLRTTRGERYVRHIDT